MKIQILKTTDGKRIGRVYELPAITYEAIEQLGMQPTRIDTEKCIVQSSHYTIKYKVIEE